MSAAESPSLEDNVRRVVGGSNLNGVPDAELLARFVKEHDEAAFELLLWRHGGLVLNVCLRVLGDRHQAEDAFQVTFLTLAQRAGAIGRGEAVAGWLYQVAHRVALRMRARSRREQPLGDMPLPGREPEPAETAEWRDLRPLLDAEVDRLPEKYRIAFVLCYLEGKTNEEAARELGCPRGTVDSRLARARERLRARLARRGLAIALLPLTLTLLQHAGEARLTEECVAVSLHRALRAAALAPVAASFLPRVLAATVAVLTTGLLAGMLAHAVAYPLVYPSSHDHESGGCGVVEPEPVRPNASK